MSLTTGTQVRAARALLRMEQEQLAKAAGVSGNTVRRIEGFDGPMDARLDTIRRLQRVFEAAGVEFIPGGARLREAAETS